MILLTQAQIDQYHRDGYLLVRDVFTPAEMDGFRRAAAAYRPGVATYGRIFGIPGLDGLWRDERIVTVAAQLLGEDPAFFCQGDFVRFIFTEGEPIKGRHAHHDAKGTPGHLFNRLHAPQSATYPLVRFGIYFQSFADTSGGLKVSPGSHRMDSATFDESRLPYVNVPSRSGDLVCFCFRTIHSPYALRLKNQPDAVMSPWTEDRAFRRDPGAFRPAPLLRETVFIDYAAPSQDADLLIKGRALHNPDPARILARQVQEQRLVPLAEELGLHVRLDVALMETVYAIRDATRAGVDPAPLLPALKEMSRHCAPWSSHFPLFDDLPADDSPESLVRWSSGIAARADGYVATYRTKLPDRHMGEIPADMAAAV